jgi:tetratricopeptide (TPR) repeat protein
MTNEANTRRPEGADREAVDKAAALVGDADALLGDAFGPGEWPEADSVDRFLSEGKLDRVLSLSLSLSLYGQAMRLDSNEPAYPWNLGSAMNRLGLNDLALGFLTRAIHLSEQRGEDQWSGPDAQLAVAEVAIDAGEYDLALTALAHARADDQGNGREAQIGDLLKEVRSERGDPQPQVSLASLLERLPA